MESYYFPEPPAGDAAEWPGTPMGISNTITRTKGRTKLHDKTIDRIPGRREDLVASAIEHLNSHRRQGRAFEHDVVIHGVRVRAHTNMEHLRDFWVDNWFSPEEWQQLTGKAPPRRPQVEVYAVGGAADQEEAAYYSRQSNTIVFFNTSYYGQLKSWVLGAVGRVLAEERGIHSIHGACTEKEGKGVLFIAPTGTGKSTASYGLMDFPNTRFHSDDWVYVRYTYLTRDGRRLAPLQIRGSDGSRAQGYQVFRWIEEHGNDTQAQVRALTLNDELDTLTLGDFDLAEPIEAYAYTSEKVFYLRANLVENFPPSAYQLIHSKFENCPDLTPEFMAQNGAQVESIVEDLINNPDERIRDHFRLMPTSLLSDLVARMYAFGNARAMLDITEVVGRERAFWNPMEPLRLGSVYLLKRDPKDHTVLRSLSEADFITILMIGQTPANTREIAYNAYRAVDDRAEQEFVALVESELEERRHQGEGELHFYDVYRGHQDIPDTLYEEFELFQTMYAATSCYELNTILRSDPAVKTTPEAVAATIALLGKTIDESPDGLVLTLENYRRYLQGEPLS